MGGDAPADGACLRDPPRDWEMDRTGGIFVEQVIRPTGLIDPEVIVRPARTQVDDLLARCASCQPPDIAR